MIASSRKGCRTPQPTTEHKPSHAPAPRRCGNDAGSVERMAWALALATLAAVVLTAGAHDEEQKRLRTITVVVDHGEPAPHGEFYMRTISSP